MADRNRRSGGLIGMEIDCIVSVFSGGSCYEKLWELYIHEISLLLLALI